MAPEPQESCCHQHLTEISIMASSERTPSQSDYCLDATTVPAVFYYIEPIEMHEDGDLPDPLTDGFLAPSMYPTRYGYGPELRSPESANSIRKAVNLSDATCFLLGLAYQQDAWHLTKPENRVWKISGPKCLQHSYGGGGGVIRSVAQMLALHPSLDEFQPEKPRPSHWLNWTPKTKEILLLNGIPKEAIL